MVAVEKTRKGKEGIQYLELFLLYQEQGNEYIYKPHKDKPSMFGDNIKKHEEWNRIILLNSNTWNRDTAPPYLIRATLSFTLHNEEAKRPGAVL